MARLRLKLTPYILILPFLLIMGFIFVGGIVQAVVQSVGYLPVFGMYEPTLEHYRRYVGQEITVKTTAPIEGSRRHGGVLRSVSEHAICLEPGDAPGSTIEIPLEEIDRARTVLVWGPSATRPRGASKRRAATAAGPARSTDSKDNAV